MLRWSYVHLYLQLFAINICSFYHVSGINFLGLELHAQKVWIIAKWLACIALQKGCFNLNSIRRSVHAGHCASLRIPPPLPHLSFKKLPSPICKASTDHSLRVSFPVSFGQRNRPMGSCSPGLTVDSGLLRRCYKETPFKCEGGNIQL